MTTLASIPSRPVLAALLLASALAAAPAHAEAPSVDAYAGQALVLGAAHHRHPGGGSGGRSGVPSGSSRGRAGGGGAAGGRSGAASGSGQNQAQGRGGSGTASGKTASGGSGARGVTHPTASGGQPPTGARSGGSRAAEGFSGEAGLSASAARGGSQASAGAFSGTDLLVLIAALICLVGVGTVLRVARRSSRAAAHR
jgi:hypothetical protein